MLQGEINTGNPVADNYLRKKIADDIMAWALVTYFEKKGLLDRDEFWAVLNEECKYITQAICACEDENSQR